MKLNLGGLLKGIGNIASVAAPFLPGPWGAVAGAAGSLIAGGQDQKRANDAQKQMGGAVDQYAQNVRGSYIDPMALYQPAFDLVGANNAALYGQALEASDPAYDAAAAELGNDAMMRGVGGSALTGPMRFLRTDQARNNAGILRDIGINNTNQRIGLQGAYANAAMQGAQMRQMGEGNILNARMGHLGGLQGMYQSRAGNTGQALGQLGQALGQTGAYDWFKKTMGLGRTGQAGGSGTLGSTASQAPSFGSQSVQGMNDYGWGQVPSQGLFGG